VIQYLVEAYPESINFDANGLPLHWACKNEATLEAVQYLVERDPESVKVTDRDERLPLPHVCVCYPSPCYPSFEVITLSRQINYHPQLWSRNEITHKATTYRVDVILAVMYIV
jgi:hypothetical protein